MKYVYCSVFVEDGKKIELATMTVKLQYVVSVNINTVQDSTLNYTAYCVAYLVWIGNTVSHGWAAVIYLSIHKNAFPYYHNVHVSHCQCSCVAGGNVKNVIE